MSAERFSRAAVAERLRRAVFGGPPTRGGRPLIGAEVELLSLDAESRRPASVGRRILPFLRAYGARAGWTEEASAKGAPRFLLAAGGAVTLEPGGQVEYATRPHPSPRALLDDLAATVPPLVAAAADAGIALTGIGIDPVNGIDVTPLQLRADRYVRMDTYFATIGPAGACMMRQTAAIQVNVDPIDVDTTWRVLNAAAPYVTALFANSPTRAGLDGTVASARALAWRELDPLRTGIMHATGDPADEYAGFALWAPAMFRRDADGRYLRFCDWVRLGQADDNFLDAHLTTLFPDVRPKGYFEVRAIDALPPSRYAAPILLLAGLTQDVTALHAAAELLGAPEPALLVTAAREGLANARLRAGAAALYDIALDGCARLGVELCGEEWLDDVRRERERLFDVSVTQLP